MLCSVWMIVRVFKGKMCYSVLLSLKYKAQLGARKQVFEPDLGLFLHAFKFNNCSSSQFFLFKER